MLALIAASGELPEPPGGAFPDIVEMVADADLIIAADGGLRHLMALDARCDVVVGDLDSVSAGDLDRARRAGAEVVEHHVDKEETDLELALDMAARSGATRVVVVAMFGGRTDHELANIGLVADRRWLDDGGFTLEAHDGRRSFWVVHDSVELTEPTGTTITLLASNGPARGVSTRGLRWPLDNDVLAPGSTRGVSNVCVDDRQSVAVSSGTVVAVVDRCGVLASSAS